MENETKQEEKIACQIASNDGNVEEKLFKISSNMGYY